MDCTLSAQNALVIDRILQCVKGTSISIDTTSRILLQAVSSDRTMVLDLVLEASFFSAFESHAVLLTIPKQRFHMRKMRHLRITKGEYLLTFEYVFDKHTFRRKVFLIAPHLYSVEHRPSFSSLVDASVLVEAFKELRGASATFTADDGTARLRSGGTEIAFAFRFGTALNISLIVPNLRDILNVHGLFVECRMCYESPGSPLNFIFHSPEYRASFFTAVHG
jgi:hypothetical protein